MSGPFWLQSDGNAVQVHAIHGVVTSRSSLSRGRSVDVGPLTYTTNVRRQFRHSSMFRRHVFAEFSCLIAPSMWPENFTISLGPL